jgi:hypothetical protein
VHKVKIIVSGAVANKTGQGGEAWVRLSWVLGLRRLGFDVLFVEQLATGAPASAAGFFEETMSRFDLSDRALLIDEEGRHCVSKQVDLPSFASDSVALVNISGHLKLDSVMRLVQRRVFVDIDPGFTQAWHEQGVGDSGLDRHDVHFTVGGNIGLDDCPIPDCAIKWHKVLPPVVLEEWLPVERRQFDGFTTIANWRGSYGPVELQGRTFGLKVHEFRRFIGLLNIHPAEQKDLTALHDAGWNITSPAGAACTADAFRDYLRHSGAEFSVAQGVYVHTNSGWFSDRTAHYLASGRPALVQETGFSKNLPTGEGLIGFSTMEEAIAGAQSIARDYEAHSRAARALSESHFDSDLVLRQFCKAAGIDLPPHA